MTSTPIVVTKKQIINIFLNFLKENNIYKEYTTNLRHNIGRRDYLKPTTKLTILMQPFKYKKIDTIFYNMSRYDLGEIINYSFTWMDTPQGHEFWAKYHVKWVKTTFNYRLKK